MQLTRLCSRFAKQRVQKADVCNLFKSCGRIENVYLPKIGQRFGFVCFKSKNEALEAIRRRNGYAWNKNSLKLNIARYSDDKIKIKIKRRNAGYM